MMNLSDMADLSQEMQDDIVSIPKEVILISLVSQEQALYNPKHEHYRNTQRKDMKWMEIAERVGWTEVQCKSKWKAMRDQYCRELKRSKFNIKANVKWKYFKELDFLRPYALARNYRPRNPMPTNNNNTTTSNNNNQNAFNCAPATDNLNHSDNNNTKFATIKIESNDVGSFATCDFSGVKTDTTTNLTEEQLNNVLQQHGDDNNWTYITTGSSTSSNNNSRLDNHSLSEAAHLLSSHTHHQQHQTDEALYNALVSCVGQIQQQQHQLCQQEQQQLSQSTSSHQQQSAINDEEDDDNIHTYLKIEDYFEKDLIALIQYEDVLYNSQHPNYRNVKLKLELWDEIARKLKKTVKQCRLKWKALRDQFIREHKRLKNRDNVESLPRWKHYDALSFLQKFIKYKATGDYENKSLMHIPKSDIDGDMDDDDDEHMNMSGSSPLDNIKCEINQNQLQLPELESAVNNNHSLHQQQTEQSNSLCVTTGSVGYDDMDIDNYIMGDSDSVVDEHNNHEDGQDHEEQKSEPDFSVYHTNHNAGEVNMHSSTANLDTSNQQAFKNTTTSPQTLATVTEQQPQSINMPSLDSSDSSGNLIAPDNLKNANQLHQTATYQTSNLTNGTSICLTPTLELCSSSSQLTTNIPPVTASVPKTSEASTNTPQPLNNNTAAATISSNNAVNSEDDEVGAFFKAVAMKIRNAKLSPVAFTDLQIDILKVINGSLRNH
ncbi:uncharacterized protein isoform X2 [Musca autumnalis]